MKTLTEDQYYALNHFIVCKWDCILDKEELKILKSVATVIKGKNPNTYNIKPIKLDILVAYYQFESNLYRKELNTLLTRLNSVLYDY